MSGLRVVSWNVRSLRDDSRGVARVLADLAPDVVLLQEAPRLLGSGWANRRLARRAGLVRVTGGAAALGNLLLVSRRTTVLMASTLRLPRRPGLHRRGAVLGVVERNGARLAVAGTHLDLDPAARVDSARRVRTAAGGLGVPLVLGADVNEQVGGPAWAVLAAGLVDTAAACGPTFPLRSPQRRIDVLLADPGLVVQAVQVPRVGPVTDHLPLVLDLAWPEPPAPDLPA